MKGEMRLTGRDLISGALSVVLNLLLWLSLSPLVGPSSPPEPAPPPVPIALLPPPVTRQPIQPPSPSPQPQTSPSPSERKSRPSTATASQHHQPAPDKTLDAGSPTPPPQTAPPRASEQSLPPEEASPSAPSLDEGKGTAPSTSPAAEVEPAEDGEAPPAKEEESPPSGADFGGWLAEVREKIARSARYPASARRTGLEGTVALTLTISPSGELVSLSVHAPEGLSALARAAEEAARQAAPFPPPPSRRGVQVEVPVVFRLSAGG